MDPQQHSEHSSAHSSPIHLQKMQFKLQQRLNENAQMQQQLQQQQHLHQQQLQQQQMSNPPQAMSPLMVRKIGTKAASAIDLSNGQQPYDMSTHLQHQQNVQQMPPNPQHSLMLHQQQKFPHQNHPIEQQIFQQFHQKAMLNQLMKIQGNNASLADFRSIVHNQPQVDDMLASKDQIHAIVNAQKHSDYIVEDYMEKIQTRIALLETELKFADRKLHVLYGEYNEMLAKIDKLENLTIAQQQVLANLLDLCNNQTQEVTAAKNIQAKAAQLFGIDPQSIMVMNQMENFQEPFQQDAVDSTATEFNELLEDLKNEAIIDGLRGQGGKNVIAPLPFAQQQQQQQAFQQHQQQFQNDYEGDADYEALIAMINKQMKFQPTFNFLQRNEQAQEFLKSQEALKQHIMQQQNAMELMKNLNEAQMNMEMEFFRSGEVNKSLFDAVAMQQQPLDMIYEDNEDKEGNGKEISPVNDKNEQQKREDSSHDEKSTGSSTRKSKTKKKKHHQQLQLQQFQLQSDDQLIHEIIEEILKLENLTNLLNKNQHDELKNWIKNEIKIFHNLKKLDMNFVTLLVSPATQPSPNSSMSLEEEDQRFEILMKKIRKNLEILKKIEPTATEAVEQPRDTLTSSKSSIYNDDEYLQSLRKSLDRHNSMQLLLHMQNPNLQSSTSKSVLNSCDFLSDEQLDGDGSSSPPPPAPNGDVYYPTEDIYAAASHLEQEWNPFHVDILMMKEQQTQQQQQRKTDFGASLSPYRKQSSPKNAKSDSGLSSMSGFSSFEKSPNSPSYSLPYDHATVTFRGNIRSQDYLKLLNSYQQMKAAGTAADVQVTSPFLFSDVANPTVTQPQDPNVQQPTADEIFGEENLNYIKELSQNVPICSIYENKSIFDNVSVIKPASAWEVYVKNQQQVEEQPMKAYPDLIANQEVKGSSGTQKTHQEQDALKNLQQQQQLEALMEQRRKLDAQKLQLKQEQQALLQKSKQRQQQQPSKSSQRQLTDHLVYYPSQQSITDYNSSMNLEYQREYPPAREPQHHQNLQHDEFMQHAHAQQQVHLQHLQQRQMQQQQQQQQQMQGNEKVKDKKHHAYLNKMHNWLPEIKIKKMSKRHRSHSLPGQVDNEEFFENQGYKMNLKQQQQQQQQQQPHPKHGKKGDIYVMKNYMKGKKKEIVRAMSSVMHKAQKSVRRHSISHHHLSDDENLPDAHQSRHSPKFQQVRATRSLSAAPPSSKGRSYSDTETDISSMFSDSEDHSGAPIFATMADSMTKHSDAGDSDGKNSCGDKAVSDSSTGSKKPQEANSDQSGQFNLNFTSTSMEFAASRKVGILRKKSSNADGNDESLSPTGNESFEAVFEKSKKPPAIGSKEHHMLTKTHSIFVDSIDDNDEKKPVPFPRHDSNESQPQSLNNKPIPSPRFEHSRSNSIKASLEVPGGRDEDDSKSQNSFRTSISSRRQSTEDSIDTDDEYFYYEMRNLEELERNSHMESILQDNKNQLISNIMQLDKTLAEPDDDVKKNMSNVLSELKAKVKLREPVDNLNNNISNNKKKSTNNIYDKFNFSTNINDMPWNRESDDEYNDDEANYMNQINQFESEIRDSSYGKVKKKRKKSKQRERYEKSSSSSADDEDDKSIASLDKPQQQQQHDDFHLGVDKFERPHSQSSGVTSGPDSPIASDEELETHFDDGHDNDNDDDNDDDNGHNDDKLIVAENYEDFKQRQKNERLLEHSQQPPQHPNDDRGANDGKVQSGNAAAENELKNNIVEMEDGKRTIGGMKKLMQLSSTMSTDSTNQDSGISDTSGGTAGSSKWKLLKTLKERKEMNNQVKIKEEEECGKEKPVREKKTIMNDKE